jgi:hypothetical protein
MNVEFDVELDNQVSDIPVEGLIGEANSKSLVLRVPVPCVCGGKNPSALSVEVLKLVANMFMAFWCVALIFAIWFSFLSSAKSKI